MCNRTSQTQEQNKDQGGFTLIEMLVAMTIVAIGMLGMAGMMASVARAAVFSKQMTTAATMANDKLEEAVGLASGGVDLSVYYANASQLCDPTNSYAGAVYYKIDSTTGGGVVAGTSSNWDYRRCLQIQTVTIAGVSLKRISVTMDWLWNGKTKSDGNPYSITQLRDVAQ